MKELQIKTTITDIEAKIDKNLNPYFKISANWGLRTNILYAFSTDFNLDKSTLETLTNSAYKFVNRLVLITYHQSTFYKVKKIELV